MTGIRRICCIQVPWTIHLEHTCGRGGGGEDDGGAVTCSSSCGGDMHASKLYGWETQEGEGCPKVWTVFTDCVCGHEHW